MCRASLSPSSIIKYLLGRLNEEERAAGLHDRGNAPRLAGLARRIGDLSGKDLIIVLLHDVLGPLLQIRVGQVGDVVVRLLTGAASNRVVDIGMGRIGTDGSGRARDRYVLDAVIAVPTHAVRGKIGRGSGGLCVSAGKNSGAGEHDRAANKKP
jgi:hypothetical protein